jgi:hypothetical protein
MNGRRWREVGGHRVLPKRGHEVQRHAQLLTYLRPWRSVAPP